VIICQLLVGPAWSGWCFRGLRGSLRGSWCRGRCGEWSGRADASTGWRPRRSWLISWRSTHDSRRRRRRRPSLSLSTGSTSATCIKPLQIGVWFFYHIRVAKLILGSAFGTVIWGRQAVGARWPMRCYYSKERTGSLEALRCDHCTISNHSAATCHRMFPTLKSTGSGSLWDKILGGMNGQCNANFKAIWEAHGTVVCKRNRSISFAVLHNAWTWQTDRQTDRPLSGNIDTNRRNRFQWCWV